MGYDGTLKFDTSIDSSGFQSGLSKLSGMASGAIKATTTILAGAATAVAGIGTAAIKVGSDFEAGMSKVQSISGASATEIQQLADKAKEMGAKTKFSATESAEAFQYIWYREDWHLEDLEEAIRNAGLEVTQERVDKLLEECHRIFDDKSGRNEMLAQKASELFEEE